MFGGRIAWGESRLGGISDVGDELETWDAVVVSPPDEAHPGCHRGRIHPDHIAHRRRGDRVHAVGQREGEQRPWRHRDRPQLTVVKTARAQGAGVLQPLGHDLALLVDVVDRFSNGNFPLERTLYRLDLMSC